jgi:hypothetical protein
MLEANAPPAKPNERATARVGDHAALLRTSLRQVRHRAFVILNPRQIARLDKAAANLAMEKMISPTHAPPVGALAKDRRARARFIDRHDRRHLAASQKKLVESSIEQTTTTNGALNTDCREALPYALDASFEAFKNPRFRPGGFFVTRAAWRELPYCRRQNESGRQLGGLTPLAPTKPLSRYFR